MYKITKWVLSRDHCWSFSIHHKRVWTFVKYSFVLIKTRLALVRISTSNTLIYVLNYIKKFSLFIFFYCTLIPPKTRSHSNFHELKTASHSFSLLAVSKSFDMNIPAKHSEQRVKAGKVGKGNFSMSQNFRTQEKYKKLLIILFSAALSRFLYSLNSSRPPCLHAEGQWSGKIFPILNTFFLQLI